jgi:ribose/xylose/arabinose/galactoside ABC-type transport system permease subunit
MIRLKKLSARFPSKGIIIAFIILFVIAAVLYNEKNFLTVNSLANLLKKSSTDGGLLAIGMTFVLLIGGIDLSVGSVLALSGVIAALVAPVNPVLAILAGLSIALLVGLLNGLLVTRLQILPFIATLATMMGVRGIVYIVTNQKSIPISDGGVFSSIANSSFLHLTVPVYVLFASVLVSMYIARNTRVGLAFYSVGGNEEAARMMGLNVNRVKIIAYLFSSFFAGLNGILLASRLNAGQAVAAEGWEMIAIASAVLGGTKLTGGSGKFSGTFFGILTIGIINTIFNYQGNINTWWQNVIMGSLLLFSVIIQSDVLKVHKRVQFQSLSEIQK